MIELELHFFFGRQTDAVHFPQGRVGRPEGYDVVELSAHGRDKTGVISCLGCIPQQGIRESFLVDFIVDDVARLQCTQFQHNLAGSPVDSSGRSGVVAGLAHIDRCIGSVGMVDGHSLEGGGCRQRVVIVFQYPLLQGSGSCLHPYGPADRKRTLSGGFHRHTGTVQ